MMKEMEVHQLAAILETRNKLKSLLRFAKIPSGVTITFASGSATRSVTVKDLASREMLVETIEDRIHQIEDLAVDLGVEFGDK